MKIGNTQLLHHPGQGERSRKDPRPYKIAAPIQMTNPVAITRLDAPAQSDCGDIDPTRIAEIRQAIKAGRFAIRPARIADGLIDSARDLLGEDSS